MKDLKDIVTLKSVSFLRNIVYASTRTIYTSQSAFKYNSYCPLNSSLWWKVNSSFRSVCIVELKWLVKSTWPVYWVLLLCADHKVSIKVVQFLNQFYSLLNTIWCTIICFCYFISYVKIKNTKLQHDHTKFNGVPIVKDISHNSPKLIIEHVKMHVSTMQPFLVSTLIFLAGDFGFRYCYCQ